MFAAVTEDQLKEFYLMWMERCLELERVVSERQGSCIGALEIYDLGYTRPGVLSFALSHCRFLSAAGVGMSQLHSKGLAMMSRVLGLGQACLGHRLPCWHASPKHARRSWLAPGQLPRKSGQVLYHLGPAHFLVRVEGAHTGLFSAIQRLVRFTAKRSL